MLLYEIHEGPNELKPKHNCSEREILFGRGVLICKSTSILLAGHALGTYLYDHSVTEDVEYVRKVYTEDYSTLNFCFRDKGNDQFIKGSIFTKSSTQC
jgi:hypothetical protein